MSWGTQGKVFDILAFKIFTPAASVSAKSIIGHPAVISWALHWNQDSKADEIVCVATSYLHPLT